MDTVLLGVRFVLAAVFSVAGLAKLADAQGSRQAIVDFGLPAFLAPSLGLLLPIAEIVVALALISATSAWWGSVGAAVMLLTFMGAIGYNLAHGRTPSCHCFGQLHSAPTGWSTFVRNAVFAVMAVFLVARGPADIGPSVMPLFASLSIAQLVGLVGSLITSAVIAILGWLFLHLVKLNGRLLVRVEALEACLNRSGGSPSALIPAQTLPATGLPVGSPAPVFSLSSVLGETISLNDLLATGRPLLLVFSDPACGPCTGLVPDIAGWQSEYSGLLDVALISRGTPEANRAKIRPFSITTILLQQEREIAQIYDCAGTPGAVIVNPEGRIGSPLAMGADAIKALVADVAREQISLRRAPPIRMGEPAPALELPDLTGQTVDLTRFKGKATLLLFWNPACGYCSRMLAELKRWEADVTKTSPQLLVLSSGAVEENLAMNLRSPVLVDPSFRAGKAFGVGGTPSAVLLDADGKLASSVAVGAAAVLSLADEQSPSLRLTGEMLLNP